MRTCTFYARTAEHRSDLWEINTTLNTVDTKSRCAGSSMSGSNGREGLYVTAAMTGFYGRRNHDEGKTRKMPGLRPGVERQ